MAMRLIDIIGRVQTVYDVIGHLKNAYNVMSTAYQQRFNQLVNKYKAMGYDEDEAKVWALWEMGELDADPQMVLAHRKK